MNIGAFPEQCQVTFAAQQGFHPVHQAHGGGFCGRALADPLRRAGQQSHQAHTGFVAQRQHTRVFTPAVKPLAQGVAQLRQQVVHGGVAIGCFAALAAFALGLWPTQQFVKLLRHLLAVGIKLFEQLL